MCCRQHMFVIEIMKNEKWIDLDRRLGLPLFFCLGTFAVGTHSGVYNWRWKLWKSKVIFGPLKGRFDDQHNSSTENDFTPFTRDPQIGTSAERYFQELILNTIITNYYHYQSTAQYHKWTGQFPSTGIEPMIYGTLTQSMYRNPTPNKS
mgnify:CR=1 FL=1